MLNKDAYDDDNIQDRILIVRYQKYKTWLYVILTETRHYGVWDIRTTAYLQFEFLSNFCSLSKEMISEIQIDINNNKLVTLYLLSQKQIQIQINGTIDYLKNSARSRMITFFNYLENTRLVNQYLNNLFITNWSTKVNYTKYFQQCSPSICSYSKVERAELVYVMTLFISLYGDLTVILHLITSFFIDIIVKWKCFSKSTNENSAVEQRLNKLKFVQTINRLSLFKNINDRTEQSIKNQKVITCVYLIVLIGDVL
ncbi:unnamed protein product [Adineta steineri]|uniref:Uncharacterized protein n=1 Tax=Adineta steineri TaxID=433720 RepID=A0A815TCT9_9BILA|nr:unnamed protein product [Adineta steineri]